MRRNNTGFACLADRKRRRLAGSSAGPANSAARAPRADFRRLLTERKPAPPRDLLGRGTLAILGFMSRRSIPLLILLASLLVTTFARADEIRLKDGTKITGTIVGFENDSFRIETSYGFALVQKDKVADINISAAKKDPEPKPKPSTPTAAAAPSAVMSPEARPAVSPAVVEQSLSRTSVPAAANSSTTDRLRAAANPIPTPVKLEPVPIKTIAAPAAPAPTASAVPPLPPPTPPEPFLIRDEIRGNLYVNHTYGFQMYKPPSWELIPAARKALPDAVAALGTFDQTTLLVIGRAPAKGSLDAYAAVTGKALGGVYENYRLIGTNHLTIAGLPAVEQRSRGTADGRDWSVVLVTLLRGSDAFTLLGMTWADSDLIQVQENVISKAVNSFTFSAQ
jgi:hypothetical protein